MALRRYSKSTKGFNGSVFVINDATAPTETTLDDFIKTGSAGEAAIFLESGAVNTDILATGEKFRLVQLVNGQARDGQATGLIAKSTPLLEFDKADPAIVQSHGTAVTGWYATGEAQNHVAAVKKAVTVGHDGSADSAGDLGISITSGTDEFTISARDVTPGNQPFPVQEGRHVVTASSASAYDVASAVAKDFNKDFDWEGNADEGFAYADVVTDTDLDLVTTGVTITAKKGSNVVVQSGTSDVVADDIIGITANSIVRMYKVLSKSGNNITLDRAWRHDSASSLVLTEFTDSGTYVDGTSALGLYIEAYDVDTNFVVSAQDGFSSATIADKTSWVIGVGNDFQVSELEKEGEVFAGYTTLNAAFAEDFGKPDSQVVSGEGYDIIIARFKNAVQSDSAPIQNQEHYYYLVIASADGSGTQQVNILENFGVDRDGA